MHLTGNSIFQRAGRSTISTNKPIHMNLYAIERKFNWRGHQKAIFVKHWFRNIILIRLSKKIGQKNWIFFSNGCHFVIQEYFRKGKKMKLPKFSYV